MQNNIKMKTILNVTEDHLPSVKITGYEKSIQVSYIAKREGSPKWIWSTDNNAPLFLFYTI